MWQNKKFVYGVPVSLASLTSVHESKRTHDIVLLSQMIKRSSHPFSSVSAPVSWHVASSVLILCSTLCQCCDVSFSSGMPCISNSGYNF